jgi:hypothetical protein
MVLQDLSWEDSIKRSIISGGFILYPVEVGKFFQIFVSVVLICFYDCINAVPHLSLDLGVFNGQIDCHHK